MDYPTICIQCGKSFEGKRADTKYCSSTCRSRASREANSDGGLNDAMASTQSEASESIVSSALSPMNSNIGDMDIASRLAMMESRLAVFAGMSERLEQLENRGQVIDRVQSRLSMIENGMTEFGDSEARIKRLEGEQAKVDAQLTRLAPLAGLPERLKGLERRASEPGDLPNRIEALEARNQVVQRLQKTLAELQSRLEAGLEEARARKGLDATSAQRLIDARVAPLEQRVERVVAQSRVVTPTDDSRFVRLEQKLERLQARVQASPDEDLAGRLVKLERKLALLQGQLNDANSSGSELAPAVSALNSRVESVAEDLSSLRSDCLRMAYAVRALQGYDEEEEEEESDSDWDDDE